MRLHVAEEPYGPWEAVERLGRPADASGTPPPFWAFSWPGGAALARHVLDEPALVAGRRVVDLGCGTGLVGIAAALAGAAQVTALDVEPLALAATRLNAALNGVTVEAVAADLARLAAGAGVPGGAQAAPGPPSPAARALEAAQVVLAGDMFFERRLADDTLTVLRRAHEGGAAVRVGDPGRAHLPGWVFTEVATYDVPTPAGLEDAAVRRTRVLRLA